MSLESIEKIICECFRDKPIAKAWIFGSFARGEETPLSDIDVLVEYEPGGVSLLKHAAIICELENRLNRPVDLVQAKLLRPSVKESIEHDRKLIYERAC